MYCAQEVRIPHSNIIIIYVRMLCDNYIWCAESEECATHPERGERARSRLYKIEEMCWATALCSTKLYNIFLFRILSSQLFIVCISSSIRYARASVLRIKLRKLIEL